MRMIPFNEIVFECQGLEKILYKEHGRTEKDLVVPKLSLIKQYESNLYVGYLVYRSFLVSSIGLLKKDYGGKINNDNRRKY